MSNWNANGPTRRPRGAGGQPGNRSRQSSGDGYTQRPHPYQRPASNESHRQYDRNSGRLYGSNHSHNYHPQAQQQNASYNPYNSYNGTSQQQNYIQQQQAYLQQQQQWQQQYGFVDVLNTLMGSMAGAGSYSGNTAAGVNGPHVPTNHNYGAPSDNAYSTTNGMYSFYGTNGANSTPGLPTTPGDYYNNNPYASATTEELPQQSYGVSAHRNVPTNRNLNNHGAGGPYGGYNTGAYASSNALDGTGPTAANLPDRNVPEPPKFVCEACDVKFAHISQHRAHINTHVKCPHCDFTASKKVVRLHEEEEHGIVEGLQPIFTRKLDTPEEIEKWIAERKKNWPTEGNIAKKEAERKERQERGGLSRDKKPRKVTKVVKSEPTIKRERTSTNDSSLEMIGSYATDEDGEPSQSTDASDSTSESDNSQDSDTEAKAPQQRHQRERPICKFFLKKRCFKKDCTFRHVRPEATPRKPFNANVAQHNRKPLLRKLLEPEIRKEKNAILQCIRYIVRNNFLMADGDGERA
ncbi:hypothetical protein BC832DRAFT_275742 [Gaertneriomyces semiglobifer]|nr:hypothetical protein BC832DRAFT_275742 [Gaertneriomyces semiglobifer]